jgi:hypothetical protein
VRRVKFGAAWLIVAGATGTVAALFPAVAIVLAAGLARRVGCGISDQLKH